jgi:two-component system, OmpR family, osmolarity sensor histidine kinase EnvZ
MRRGATGTSLAAQYARWLAALFIAIELLTAAVALVFILLPLSQRAADDLVGLMVLSAQTWAELPPATRPVFEDELLRTHQLALRPDMPAPADTGLRHGFYIRFLERALARRAAREMFLIEDSGPDGGRWLWTTVAAGDRSIGVGFAVARLQTNPLVAAALATIGGALLVAVLAWWLARRIARPIARLEAAAAQLALGARPALLPESGPRELADLARHFNRMAVQVRELADARTTLFAGISHDLRTPLARMRLALEMLSIRPDPELLRKMDTDIEQMNSLIAQLLDIARGLANEPSQPLALCEWLEQRVQSHHAAAAAAGATLRVDCDRVLRVQAPPGMLGRVVDNLIDNALRYAPGPIDVLAQRVIGAAGQAVVRIGVLDRGPGIPADQLDVVFRPFHRIEASRSPVTGGFGLGLAVVRQLATAHGWRATLAARDGGGLAAWIEINAPV